MCEDCLWARVAGKINEVDVEKVEARDAEGKTCSCDKCTTPDFVVVFDQHYEQPGDAAAIIRTFPWCIACHHPIENSLRRVFSEGPKDSRGRASQGFA